MRTSHQRAFTAFLLLAFFAGTPSFSTAAGGHDAEENGSKGDHGNHGNHGVAPPGSKPYGKSYAEWGATWWKYVFSVPWTLNPLNDQTGANFASGQSGKVWFLAGTVAQGQASNLLTATRTSTLPAGKALFFPILNTECSTFEGNGTTEADLLACATTAIDQATALECDVDGEQLHDLQAYRAHSGLFTWGPLPADNIFTGLGVPPDQAPAGTTSPAVHDGYYIMLRPLHPGSHTIHFHGAFGTLSALDITYHLTVVPHGHGQDDVATESEGVDATAGIQKTTWGRLKLIYRR